MTTKPTSDPAAAAPPALAEHPDHSDGDDPERAKILGSMAVAPALAAATAIRAFDAHIGNTDLTAVIEGINAVSARVKAGDLSDLEHALVSQALGLQGIFANLAGRAARQDQQRHFEGFLALALRAQAQSRATIEAVVELKYPRALVFAKQANVNQGGMQQVNNGVAPAHVEATPNTQNRFLEHDDGKPGSWMDPGAAAAPARSDTAMETVGASHRPADAGGQGASRQERFHGRHVARAARGLQDDQRDAARAAPGATPGDRAVGA